MVEEQIGGWTAAIHAGQTVEEKNMEDKSRYYTDMGVCQPGSALSREQEAGKWFLVDYEMEDGRKGTMMFGEPETPVSAITLPLDVEGWHSVHIGVNYTRTELSAGSDEHPEASVKVKLTGDRGYTTIGSEALGKGAPGIYENKMGRLKETWNSVYEVFWKNADLSGQNLEVAPIPPETPGGHSIANIAWVRLVPLSEAGVEEHRKDLPTVETKRLAACFCLGMITGATSGTSMYHPTDRQYMRDLIEPFRESDFELVILECIRGDMCAYKTKIGNFAEPGQSWDPSWIDPLEEAIAWTRDCGSKPFVSMRMVGSGYPLKRSPLQRNSFYYGNQKLAIRDEKGLNTSNLSLAYPEIRNHWISFLREALQYGADGVHLCFNRNNPFVLYEEPVSSTFRERHGIDPLTLPYDDPRWLEHRCGFVNQYFREIREMLEEEGKKRGERLGFAVTFFYSPSPQYHAMDPAAWVEEKLVDYLMPHTLVLGNPNKNKNWVEHFSGITRGSEVKLYPDIFPRTPSGKAYAEELKGFYEAGADGFSFWSAEMRTTRASEWAVVKRLGHRDRMDRYKELADTYWRRSPIWNLGGISTRYSHTDG